MKYKRSTVLPVILFVYLAMMAVIGIKGLKSGETSVATYVVTIVVTLALIVTLHFFLKKRERLRDERFRDIQNSQNNNK